MLLLATTDHEYVAKLEHPRLGRLVQPRSFPRVRDTAEAGIPWAADNDAFGGFRPAPFAHMAQQLAGLPGCRFVAVPDQLRCQRCASPAERCACDDYQPVGDLAGTHERFEAWAPRLAELGLPLAFVLQNGQPVDTVPWDRIAAVFVGGDDLWKMGDQAAGIVREAKRRGLWAHMGRVNTRQRIRYAKSIGCDSVDGTGWTKWRTRNLPDGLKWVSEPLQPQLA